MAMFHVSYRRVSPITVTDVEAETHEEAVAQIVAASPEGEEVQVMNSASEPVSPVSATATPAKTSSHSTHSRGHAKDKDD